MDSKSGSISTMETTLLPDAATVARNAGIQLRARGSRQWACCPIHNEKTPSMCFFPDGKFHCFGCGAHGDAVDLYAALHGVSLGEALRVVRGGPSKPRPRKATAEDLRRKLNDWKGQKWTEACRQLHKAEKTMMELQRRYTPEQLQQSELFWQTADRKATAGDTLNLLDSATMAQLLNMYTEEK